MSNSFKCKNVSCGKTSKSSGIEQEQGKIYVVCEHCKSKNELSVIPNAQNGPVILEPIGIIKP